VFVLILKIRIIQNNYDLDPDWRKTPIFKRLQKLKRDRFTLCTENERGVKRNSDGNVKCSCKGVCKNKLCGCRKIGSKCTKECKCDHSACKNQDQISKRLYCDSSSESVYENRDPDEEIFKKPREMPGEEMFYNTIRKRKNPGKYFADSPS